MSSATSFTKLALLVSLPVITSAHAAELSSSIGVGGTWKQEHIKGEYRNTSLFPYINLQYGSFKATPNGVGASLSQSSTNQFSVLLKYRQSSFDYPENRTLRHLTERDDAVELALAWQHSNTYFDLTSTLARDVSDTHEGYEAKVKLSKSFTTPVGMFIPSATIAYQSDDLANYYYGVSPTEATSDIQAYQADATINHQVALLHIFPITDHWHTSTQVSYHHLGSELANSSIVEHDDYWATRLTVFYKF